MRLSNNRIFQRNEQPIRRMIGLLIALAFSLAAASAWVQQSAVKLSTPEQLNVDLSSVPCKNGERLNAAKALFERLGAPASDTSIDRYRNVENLVIRRQGLSEEKIIVGAHSDKVPDRCGAIDNWSGIIDAMTNHPG